MKRILVAALVLLSAGAAFAQETPAPPPPPGPKTVQFRALQYVAEGDYRPLSKRTIQVLMDLPGDAPSKQSATSTDDAGDFEVVIDTPTAETTLEFLISDENSGDRWPRLAAPPQSGDIEGGSLPFFTVEGGSDPLLLGNYAIVASVPDRESGHPSVRLQYIASVVNPGNTLWIGSRGRIERGTFRLPVPAGLEVAAFQVDGHDAPLDFDASTRELVVRDRIWPGSQLTVRAVLIAPYVPGQAFDFSFVADRPYEAVSLNLEEGQFTYEPSRWIDLQDAGVNERIKERVTHIWHAGDIQPDDDVGMRFVVGATAPTRIHPKVWRTLGIFALAIVGAVLVARGLAGTSRKPEVAVAQRPEDRDAKIRELDRRRLRGEITSFEHAARKQFLLNDGRPPEDVPARAARAAPAAAAVAAPEDPRRMVERIAARVDRADEATLRADVRALVDLLRRTGE